MLPPRQKTLTRPPNPEQLDALLKVVPSFAWISLSVLLGATVIGLLWSIFDQALVKTEAKGVLLSRAGVADVVAPASGRLAQVLVRPGDRIKAGQVVAYISQPELEAAVQQRRTEAAKLQERSVAISKFLSGQAAARSQVDVVRRKALNDRIAALRLTETAMTQMVAGQQQLLNEGIITRDRFLSAQQQLADIRSQLDSARSDLVSINAGAATDTISARREMMDVEMNLAAANREISGSSERLKVGREVIAPIGGVVADQLVNVGEVASGGAPLLRVLPGSGQGGSGVLVAIMYVPPTSGGHAVAVGMPVQVIPNSVRVERDGFIMGNVIEVSSLAATPEGMMRILKNATLVQSLSQDGAPVQAVVELKVDPKTISGYRWSSGKGPAQRVTAGTLTEGKIVTDSIPMIALVMPRIETVLTKLGL